MYRNPDDLNPDKTYVSGPMEVVRLEGSVGAIKKVIYLLMDFHIDLGQQTECSNIYAQSIQEYLIKNLRNSQKPIDFFFENFTQNIYSSLSNLPEPPYNIYGKQLTKKYILGIALMLKKLFNYNSKSNKAELPLIDNLRIHYLDVRQNLTIAMLRPNLFLFQSMEHLHENGANEQVKGYIETVKKDWIEFHGLMTNCLSDVAKCKITEKPNDISQNKTDSRLNEKYISYIFHKMIHKYSHKDVQKKLNDILKKIKIDELINLYDEYYKLYNEYYIAIVNDAGLKRPPEYSIRQGYGYDTYGDDVTITLTRHIHLHDLLNKIGNHTNAGIIYMDVFFLRRFLDKDYITNVVAYTGAMHSANYTQILIQKFGFRITHISNPGVDVAELTSQIASTADLRNVEYLLYPNELYQCSDLSSFPKNFE